MTKAQDEKIITDDLELENNDKDENDEKETERIGELSKKKDITEDEQKELDGLKKERSTRYQKRINELTWKANLHPKN